MNNIAVSFLTQFTQPPFVSSTSSYEDQPIIIPTGNILGPRMKSQHPFDYTDPLNAGEHEILGQFSFVGYE